MIFAMRAEDALATSNAQIPTPPWVSTPLESEADSEPIQPAATDASGVPLVSVSTTFYPGAQHQSVAPDAVLLSSDGVFFYVHSRLLLSCSENAFSALFSTTLSDPDRTVVNVPETSAVLNIILHAVYSISCAHYSPSFEHLCTAVRRLPFYGLRPHDYVSPLTPLYVVLLSYAQLYPIELYALAASLDLHELAVSTSSHLLSFPLFSLSDEMATAIGPVYLKRLFFLHHGRSDALRRVLLSPPLPHAPTKSCDSVEQKKLTRAWALASAYLAWDARPDLSPTIMELALRPLEQHLSCDQCKHSLRDRIQNLITQWSTVKRTI